MHVSEGVCLSIFPETLRYLEQCVHVYTSVVNCVVCYIRKVRGGSLRLNHNKRPEHILLYSKCVSSSGDDHQALIWDIQPMPKPIEVPILAYAAEGEINQASIVHR